MKHARNTRVIRTSRPVVRAVLMTTAVAWSIGVQIPAAESRTAAQAQSVTTSRNAAHAPANAPTVDAPRGARNAGV